MKCAVVGGGSIGLRHRKILEGLGHQVALISAHSPVAEFKTLAVALERGDFEYVVVASETSKHFDDIDTLTRAKFSGRVLVEKPLFEKPQKLVANNFSMSGVGYNLRFHPGVLWLTEKVKELGGLTSAHFYVGQHLPTWRTNTEYSQSSSAKRQSGGGALRDLSHELDLVQFCFGDWKSLAAIGGKFSNLEIETDDTFSVLSQTTMCPAVTVSVNYLDRTRQRKITINGNNGTLQLDLIRGVGQLNETEIRFETGTEETYSAQHQAMLAGDQKTICSFDQGRSVVEMIRAIEKAANKKRWVKK
ncbi:MAG: Gfo/Idh/MocA family protein [Actinomycetota bacterium]